MFEARASDEQGSRLEKRPGRLGLDAGEEWRTLSGDERRSVRVRDLRLEETNSEFAPSITSLHARGSWNRCRASLRVDRRSRMGRSFASRIERSYEAQPGAVQFDSMLPVVELVERVLRLLPARTPDDLSGLDEDTS